MNCFKKFPILSSMPVYIPGRILSCCLRIFLIAVLFVPFFAKSSQAMDYIVGAKGGYFVWDPYLKRVGPSQFEQIETGSGTLYGPVLSVIFNQDFSFSFSGLFGKQSSYWTAKNYYSDGETEPRTGTFTFEVKRIDLDSALSYRVLEKLKVFIGYKYQRSDVTMNSVEYRLKPGNVNSTNEHIKMPMYATGPALGLGISTPIGDRYFFAGNISAIYMWGKFDFDSTSTTYQGNGTQDPPEIRKIKDIKTVTRGINAEPTIGASTGEGMPVFTLGFRFQWSQIKVLDSEKLQDCSNKWLNDFQYGVYVSIVQPF